MTPSATVLHSLFFGGDGGGPFSSNTRRTVATYLFGYCFRQRIYSEFLDNSRIIEMSHFRPPPPSPDSLSETVSNAILTAPANAANLFHDPLNSFRSFAHVVPPSAWYVGILPILLWFSLRDYTYKESVEKLRGIFLTEDSTYIRVIECILLTTVIVFTKDVESVL
jgi:hypothetical protein